MHTLTMTLSRLARARALRALALAAACCPSAHAADVLPAHLVGTWGTAPSLYDGTTGQSHLHFQADGFGVAVGSTPPTVRTDGVDDGKPAPRAVIGFGLRVRLDGEVLVAQPFLPGQPAQAMPPPYRCRYDAAGPTLTCSVPTGGQALSLKRYHDTLPDEVATMIEGLRQQARTTTSSGPP